jgi:hypothetical protein
MSRKKKSVFGFSAQMPKNEKVQEQEKANETEQTNVTEKRNTSNKTENDSIKTKIEVEQENQNMNQNNNPIQSNQQDKGFLEQFLVKRPTIEETHKRQTFLIDKQILKRLDRLAKKHPKGFKTHFVNYCLKKGLDELE